MTLKPTQTVLGVALLALLYIASGRLGLMIAVPPGYATIIWPPSGIAMGILLAYGARLWPGVWLGSFILNGWLTAPETPATLDRPEILAIAAIIATGSTVQALCGWCAVRCLFGVPIKLSGLRQGVFLFLICGPLACIIAASVGTVTLYAAGLLKSGDLARNWMTWWGGDTFGVLVFMPLIMLCIGELKDFRDYRSGRKPLSSLAVMTVIVPLVLTFYAWKLSATYVAAQQRQEFETLAAQSEKNLIYRLESYSHMLLGAAGFVASADGRDFTAREWQSMADAIGIEDNFPGMNGLAYYHEWDERDVPALTAELRAQLGESYTVPAPLQDGEYFVITRSIPQSGPRTLLGMNVAAEKMRRDASVLARDTGRPVMSGWVDHLILDPGRKPGFIVVRPVYRGGTIPDALAERRAQFLGWVGASFTASHVFSDLLANTHDLMGMHVYDGDRADPARMIFDTGAHNNHEPAFHVIRTLDVLQHHLTMIWCSTSRFEVARQSPAPLLIMAGGLVFSMLYAAFLRSITRRTAIVEGLVREKTREAAQQKEEAERQREQALNAASARTDFLARMSHEIRTPMNGILGFIEMLDHTRLDAEQRDYVHKAQNAGKTLLRIIGDILDLSRIESGKMEMESRSFDIRDSLNICIDMIRGDTARKGLRLNIDIDPDCPRYLVGDRYRLKQVVINLLANAVKFTGEGFVRLRADYSNGWLEFSVTDSGIGIATEKLPTIFDSFVQEDSGMSRRFGGSGLGLSIARELVTAMGGTIAVDSTKGLGTTFTVRLPMPEGTEAAAEDAAPAAPRGKTVLDVLVVEDTPLNQDLVMTILTRAGHHPTLAVNGQDAVDRLRDTLFDIVLMDIQMPVMDGITASRIIRDEMGLRVPIIALTAHALPEQIAEFMDAGINDYLTKPFDARVLLDKIDQRAAAAAPGVPPAPEMPDAAMAADAQFYAKMVDDLYDLLGADRAAAHIDGFMVESGNKLAALAAITEPPQAYPLLHTLSSSAGSIGLNGTMKEVRRLMDDLDDLDTPAYAARLQRLRTIFAAEKTVLRDYRARRAAPPARAAES